MASPTIVATPGASNANSYATLVEAQAYFDGRLPLSGWDDAADQNVLLVMATRVLDALAQPFKTFFPAQGGSPAYYRVRRQWTGTPATATQKLAWPRVGMQDHNGNALDYTIASMTVANPTVITTNIPHGRATGESVLIANVVGGTTINGARVVTVVSDTTFSIPVNVTVVGTGGQVFVVPQPLKDALAELAGQLGLGDRTLDNDVVVQGLTSVRAGSVSLAFKSEIIPQVIPDAVYNLMPQSWLTDELYVMANDASFDLASRPSDPWPSDRSWW